MSPKWTCAVASGTLAVCGKWATRLRLAPDGRFWVTRDNASTLILSRNELSDLGWSIFPAEAP